MPETLPHTEFHEQCRYPEEKTENSATKAPQIVIGQYHPAATTSIGKSNPLDVLFKDFIKGPSSSSLQNTKVLYRSSSDTVEIETGGDFHGGTSSEFRNLSKSDGNIRLDTCDPVSPDDTNSEDRTLSSENDRESIESNEQRGSISESIGFIDPLLHIDTSIPKSKETENSSDGCGQTATKDETTCLSENKAHAPVQKESDDVKIQQQEEIIKIGECEEREENEEYDESDMCEKGGKIEESKEDGAVTESENGTQEEGPVGKEEMMNQEEKEREGVVGGRGEVFQDDEHRNRCCEKEENDKLDSEKGGQRDEHKIYQDDEQRKRGFDGKEIEDDDDDDDDDDEDDDDDDDDDDEDSGRDVDDMHDSIEHDRNFKGDENEEQYEEDDSKFGEVEIGYYEESEKSEKGDDVRDLKCRTEEMREERKACDEVDEDWRYGEEEVNDNERGVYGDSKVENGEEDRTEKDASKRDLCEEYGEEKEGKCVERGGRQRGDGNDMNEQDEHSEQCYQVSEQTGDGDLQEEGSDSDPHQKITNRGEINHSVTSSESDYASGRESVSMDNGLESGQGEISPENPSSLACDPSRPIDATGLDESEDDIFDDVINSSEEKEPVGSAKMEDSCRVS